MRRFLIVTILGLLFVPASHAWAQNKAFCPVDHMAPVQISGTTYPLAAADACSMLVFTNSSPATVSLPDPAVAIPYGYSVIIKAQGAGGVTLNAPAGGKTIDGSTAPVTITPGTSLELRSDNNNYFSINWLNSPANIGQLPGITPQQFGAPGAAVANPTEDDTAGVQKWLNALATGKYVGHCSGTYRLTASVNGYPTNGYRMQGGGDTIAATTTNSKGGPCTFYIDYNDWTSAALDLTNPNSPTTNNRGQATEWSDFMVTYNPALTAPPVAFRQRFSSSLALHDVDILQYTVNRGTLLQLSYVFNAENIRDVHFWGAGGYASAHLVPAGTTFSITQATQTLTSSAPFFSAGDVGSSECLQGTYIECFKITGFSDTSTVTVGRAASITHTAQLGAISSITGSITTGTNSLTINSAQLTSNDIGRVIYVMAAGVKGGTNIDPLRTTITGVSGTTITLADNASTSATNAIVIISPVMEIYPDGGTATGGNDVILTRLHFEQDSGVELMATETTRFRMYAMKFHAQNTGTSYGQTNYETQHNAVFTATDAFLDGADIEGTVNTTSGQILLEGVWAGNNVMGPTQGVFQTGTPRFGLYNNYSLSTFSIGPMNGNPYDPAWGPYLVASDGTSTRGAITIGSASAFQTTATNPYYQGTIANDNAAVGAVGEYRFATAPNSAAGTTVTFTAASPTVITWTANGYPTSCPAPPATYTANCGQTTPVNFTNSGGALPTGIVAGTTYWVDPATVTPDTFEISDTAAHAIAGTNHINTSDAGTGTQTGLNSYILSTGANAGIQAISLSAGDWDCKGNVLFNPIGGATATTNFLSLNTSVGLGSVVAGNAEVGQTHAAVAGQVAYATGSYRASSSAAQIIYLIANSTFSGGSGSSAWGYESCRRMR